jgi:hypothetical protein
MVVASVAVSAFAPATAQNPYYNGQNYNGYNGQNYNGQGSYHGGGTGFYRESRDRTVYFQYERDRFCAVQNEQHLRSMGGNGRVMVVPGNSDLAAGRQRPRPC